jgi:HK97 family phage major capsid protein
MTTLELQTRRDAARKRADSILADAKTESRALTKAEAKILEEAENEVRTSSRAVELLTAARAGEQLTAAQRDELISLGINTPNEPHDRHESNNNTWQAGRNEPSEPPTVKHVLTRGESLADHLRSTQRTAAKQPPFDLGKLVRGLALGRWDGAETEQRAMSEGISANGGVAVPQLTAAGILDLARNTAVVAQAGATIAPMESQTVRVPMLMTDPVASWRNELAPINDSTPTMNALTLTAKSLAAMVRISVELLEDAPMVGAAIQTALAAALAVEIDRAALLGNGTAPEPRGIANTAGRAVVPLSGTPLLNWGPFITAIGAVRQNNRQPNGIVV